VGGGDVTVPPVVIVPLPEKLSANEPVAPIELVPASEGNDPVSPLKLPVALVIVADPVPEEPLSQPIGTVIVPPSVLPEIVMVKGAVAPEAPRAANGIVELNVPLPAIPPVIVAVPVIV
jgi:hypothetical protein